MKTNVYFALLFPIVDIVSSLAIGLLLWFGGLRTALHGDLSVGEVIVFISYINLLTQPMRQIADRFNSIQRGLIGADRVFKILDEDQSLPDDGKDEIKEVKVKLNLMMFDFLMWKEVKF